MNDQDFDFQSPQDPKDPKSQVSPAILAALGATLVLAGGYYFWNSSSTASPTAAEPSPVVAPASPVTAATPPKAPTASAPPVAEASTSTSRTEPISKKPVAASQPIAPTPTAATAPGGLIPASNAQFLTNQAIKIAGREDPFKSAAAPIPTPPSPVAPKSPLGPPPPLPLPTAVAPTAVAPAAPGPVASTIPIKGIFQVQQDAYVVVGHEGGDEILRAGEYLDSPEQVQVVNISPLAHTITFREKGQDIVRNVAASP